jgi:hypothetical protein
VQTDRYDAKFNTTRYGGETHDHNDQTDMG